MQYQNDRSYYAPQQGFPGQPYFQQFPPSYAYGQPTPPIAQPFPAYPTVQPGTPAHGRPRPLDREISRSSTPGRNKQPLKSALKRTRTPDHGVGDVPLSRPMSRGRSADGHGMHRVRTRSGSRIRAFVPDHLILTLRSTNELWLENVHQEAMIHELQEDVLQHWPRGFNSADSRRGKWKIQFAGTPWAAVGQDALWAAKMILQLYRTLAVNGYSYLATVNVGNPWKPPQLIFVDSTPDHEPSIFLMMLSRAGDRLTLLEAPYSLSEQLGMELRATFPKKITADRATEDGRHVFEVKRSGYGVEVDKSMLVAFVLRFFNAGGFKLAGSVPMGTRSIFHFGQRKEIWVFQNAWSPTTRPKEQLARRPSSRQSRRSANGL
ncbi:hypothetical protein BD309DRAFT_902626 [Dichomitus squalens]|uniref:Uncharacterized protein n=1 Tax=Dichomitus squalens TaxID=114155 RepID=A0A4Q9N4W8_9APHY|nr:hypothetical protein BD311DRAFT_801941 [Dichomitus squalens]TBU38929.1 hypothetical protein BD309DRAFT_902626 [Dichomitus squalens]TBU65114.1 hypothetical protein BD310DRAFT_302373 [Dichomitus squalens]